MRLTRTVARLGDLPTSSVLGIQDDVVVVKLQTGAQAFRSNDGSTLWRRTVWDRSGLPPNTELPEALSCVQVGATGLVLGRTWGNPCLVGDRCNGNQSTTAVVGMSALRIEDGKVAWSSQLLDPIPTTNPQAPTFVRAVVDVVGATAKAIVVMRSSEQAPGSVQALIGLDPSTGRKLWSKPGLYGVRTTADFVLALRGSSAGAVPQRQLVVLDGNTGSEVSVPALNNDEYGLWMPTAAGDLAVLLVGRDRSAQQQVVLDLGKRSVLQRSSHAIMAGSDAAKQPLILEQAQPWVTRSLADRQIRTATHGTAGLNPTTVDHGRVWCSRTNAGGMPEVLAVNADGRQLCDPVPGTLVAVTDKWLVLATDSSGSQGLSIYRIS